MEIERERRKLNGEVELAINRRPSTRESRWLPVEGYKLQYKTRTLLTSITIIIGGKVLNIICPERSEWLYAGAWMAEIGYGALIDKNPIRNQTQHET